MSDWGGSYREHESRVGDLVHRIGDVGRVGVSAWQDEREVGHRARRAAAVSKRVHDAVAGRLDALKVRHKDLVHLVHHRLQCTWLVIREPTAVVSCARKAIRYLAVTTECKLQGSCQGAYHAQNGAAFICWVHTTAAYGMQNRKQDVA